jgi:hypothetical protein
MKNTRSIVAFIAIVAVGLSVLLCANIGVGGEHGTHTHEMNSLSLHTEHIRSLTLAIIPSFVLLTAFLFVFFVDGFFITPPLTILVPSLFFATPNLRKRTLLKRYFFNLRSPPFY